MTDERATGLDAVLDKLNLTVAPPPPRRQSVATLIPGEAALALDIVRAALEVACAPAETKQERQERDDARAWLRDGSRLYSARLCIEVLGVDYDALLARLTRAWEDMA